MSLLLQERMRWLRTGVLGVGVGLVIGAFEGLEIAIHLRLHVSYAEALVLCLLASLAGGVLGLGSGLAVGAALQALGRRWAADRFYSAAMAGTALLTSGFYIWHAAGRLFEVDRTLAGVALAICPLGVAGVVWYNAGYWARRELLGAVPAIGWRGVSALIALGMSLFSAVIGSHSGRPEGFVQPGRPNVLLITIDTLRRDHVSAYGAGLASTPRMDALATEGMLFWNAVTPTPETAPSHTSMMTALHPLRHQVISNGHRLSEGYTTLAELLSQEGYATAAFLSSFAVNSRTGLNQGFLVYEDDFIPGIRGFSSILSVQYALKVLMVFGSPHDFPWLLERKGHETNRLASEWIRAQGDEPWFAWVHYFEPHAPYEGPDAKVDHRRFLDHPDPTYTEEEAAELRRLYAYEAGLSDTQVGELLDLLDSLQISEKTMVIVTADHGEQLGEHDIYFHHHNLYDQSLQIPLIIYAPGVEGASGVRIHQQVRAMDLAPTVLEWLQIKREMDPSEGVSLFNFVSDPNYRSLYTSLFGRRTASLSEGTLFGARAPADMEGEQVDIKYIFDPESGGEELYNLSSDPAESVNIKEDQHETLRQLREIIRDEMGAADGLATDVDASDVEKLRAMGYVE